MSMRNPSGDLLELFRSALTGAALPVPVGPDVSSLAIGHGIVSWLLANLPPASLDALPESLITDWKTWEQQNRLRVMANFALLIRVAGMLEAAGMRTVPVKGVALSQQLYGSPWLRPAGDVDLLIERAQVPRAYALLLAAGFTAKSPHAVVTPRQWQWILDSQHDAACRDTNGMPVELQWRIHGNALLEYRDEEWVLEGLGEVKKMEMLGRTVPRLSEATTYLLTMSHLARSGWSRLIWVLDAWHAWQAALAVHSQGEMERIVAEHGAVRIHRRFLSLMDRLQNDADLGQWPPPGVAPRYFRQDEQAPARSMFSLLGFDLGLKGSLRYKWSVLRNYLASPNDFTLLRLPDWAFWLYVPLRLPLFVYRRYLRKKNE